MHFIVSLLALGEQRKKKRGKGEGGRGGREGERKRERTDFASQCQTDRERESILMPCKPYNHLRTKRETDRRRHKDRWRKRQAERKTDPKHLPCSRHTFPASRVPEGLEHVHRRFLSLVGRVKCFGHSLRLCHGRARRGVHHIKAR